MPVKAAEAEDIPKMYRMVLHDGKPLALNHMPKTSKDHSRGPQPYSRGSLAVQIV